MKRTVRAGWFLLGAITMAAAPLSASAQGGIFVTGHDPDFHAVLGGNTTGAQHFIQDGLKFVTKNNVKNILLVTDLTDPGAGYSDPRLGLTAAGYTYDVADSGAAGGAVKDLHTVNLSSYSAIVVASDFGGWLRQSELDILNARSGDVLNYINGGGGVVAFAESGPPNPGLLTHGAFGYLPFLVTSAQKNQDEVGNTVTPFGMTLGLTNADANGNASHNVFTGTGGLNVVDVDKQQQILTLAYYGRIGTTGAVPEPGTLELTGSGLLTGGAFVLRRRRRA